MNRFNTAYNKTYKGLPLLRWLPLLIGIGVLVLFLWGVSYVSRSSVDSQKESLEDAIARDVAQCYAIQGAYPESIDYLKDHYGLTYNEDLFYVDYQPIGSNIYPDITVLQLED